jgi:hypothetical protein
VQISRLTKDSTALTARLAKVGFLTGVEVAIRKLAAIERCGVVVSLRRLPNLLEARYACIFIVRGSRDSGD